MSSISAAILPPPEREASGIIGWFPPSILFGILTVATLLRCYDLGQTSFWFEELLAVEQTTGMGRAQEHPPVERYLDAPRATTALTGAAPVWSIWTTMSVDGQPPLHCIVLRVWRTLFGEGDVPARALSVVFSVLSIVLLYFAVASLHGQTAALWACGLMAVAGPQVDIAQAVRPYAMLTMLSLAMLVIIVRIESNGLTLRRAVTLAICTLAALLTHYGALPVVLALGAYSGVRFTGRTRVRVLGILVLSLLAFAATWGPSLPALRASLDPTAVSEMNLAPASAVQLIARWLELPGRFLIDAAVHPRAAAFVASILSIVPFILLRRKPQFLLWGIWLLAITLPVACIDAVYSTSALRIIHYTLPAAPAIYAILAAVLVDQPSYRKHAVPLVLALCCVLSLPSAYMRWKEDWRHFGEYMASVCRPGDVIVMYRKDDADTRSDMLYLALSHYLPHAKRNDSDTGDLLVPLVVLNGRVHYPLLQKINTAQRVWLVNPELKSMATTLFPGGKVSEERYFMMLPHAMAASPATVVRVQPVPLGIPFID